jgi:regulation of enolase protein 1 (concanavalin A-like superfamily)
MVVVSGTQSFLFCGIFVGAEQMSVVFEVKYSDLSPAQLSAVVKNRSSDWNRYSKVASLILCR